MDKQQAKTLIQRTFENPFEKNQFLLFIKNLLNKIEDAPFVNQGNYIPDAYKQYVKSLERIAKYSDDEQVLEILIITLQKDSSLDRARTMQRNFVARYLNGSRGGELKDAALVAFVSPNQSDWRFSFIKMDYRFETTKNGKTKVREEFTPARRWSFLVGPNEKSHTAQSQLLSLLMEDSKNPCLTDLEKAFDIETVTKEFFLKYRELFLRTKEALDKVVKSNPKIKADFEVKGVDTVNFAKKLLGQIVFLCFLQKKGWFGIGRDDDWGAGSKYFLRQLFAGTHGNYKNYFNDILEPLFYEALRIDRSHDDDYYSRFNCKIPFLNGGLFDPIGNYDWVHTDINLPNDLFSNSRKTKEGDEGDGILDIFDRYNFTVREDEPLEKEVAIDPELLGKAYEKFNAIRPDNFDEFTKALKSGHKSEENKFNKKFGVYYTPREIVHYMCQQSLINYLYTQAEEAGLSDEIKKQDVEDLIEFGDMITEHEATALIKQEKIKNGSLKSTEYTALLADSIRGNAFAIDQWLKEIMVCDPAVGSGAFPVGMMNEIVCARNVLSVFLIDDTRNDFEFKRRCIEHSLYGVDIDPGAVEIAKLRLWLSLVVDEVDIKNIKPLPNLDYKIVCGNSLLGVEKDLFNHKLFNDLEKMKHLFFRVTNPTQKQEYKKQIDDLISKITKGNREFDFEVYFSEVFHNKGGFDVVIANPPYVSAWAMTIDDPKSRSRIKKELSQYPFLSGHWDLYIAFVAKGHQILHSVGNLAYIVPNPILREKYASELRKYLLKRMTLKSILAFNDVNVFENVSRIATVFIAQKTEPESFYDISIFGNQDSVITLTNKESSESWENNPRHVFLISGNNALTEVLRKIENSSQKMGDFFYVNYGAQVSSKKKGAFGKKDVVGKKATGNAKPFFEGKDVQRWNIKYRNLWLDYKKDEIYGPRAPEFFEAEKLVVRKVSDKGHKLAVAMDQNGRYTDDGNVLVVPYSAVENTDLRSDFKGFNVSKTDLSLKYAIAVLLSSLETFYFRKRFATESLQGATSHTYPVSVRTLPIKGILPKEQKPFISLVDKIIAITKDDDYLQNTAKRFQVREYEKQIDQMVYELYDLTEEEIKIVEEST